MKILSCFDGMSCGQIALERARIKVDTYYASEIDKYAIKVTQYNYPNTIQLGSITDCKTWNIEQPDLIIGGSPCQGFSFAGKRLNFEDERSKLFFTFIDILKYYKPKYFLLENVLMDVRSKDVISEMLGEIYPECIRVREFLSKGRLAPIEINSALVSAQNRRRLYWTNIQGGTQPKNRYVLLKDILELITDSALTEDYITNRQNQKRWGSHFGTVKTPKSNTLCAIGKSDVILLTDRKRFLTPVECCRLQTVPDNYFKDASGNNIISNSQQYKCLGNGWTVDVISHILKNIKE